MSDHRMVKLKFRDKKDIFLKLLTSIRKDRLREMLILPKRIRPCVE